MRLPDSRNVRRFHAALLTATVLAGLAGCASAREAAPQAAAAPAQRTGPQADYPVTVGDPYVIDGVTHTPVDVLNYDEVGYLAVDEGARGYSGAHHTLPLPSYVEVTSLETGRTVLVRLERRGPMTSNDVVALSPAALAQLGASAQTPVRVRRVIPPEEQRAVLRAGNAAPLRMDTPMSLVAVLQRRLPASGSATLNATPHVPHPLESVDIAASSATPAPMPMELPQVAVVEPVPAPLVAPIPEPAPALEPVDLLQVAAVEPVPAPAVENPVLPSLDDPAPVVAEAPAEAPAPAPAAEGRFVVQAAAFANPDNARRAANVLGGEIVQSGNLYRVRTGPFATRGEAEASLANVRRAGYSDARILTSG
ncbi:MAG: SPOR domain-containing protein [Erythrobacter sp.]|nr:SPOR domain-containing protein [Erythrobacter sp.]